MTDAVQILHGDSREMLKAFADNIFDSCVTDPPYALVSIQKRFGKVGSAPAKGNDVYMRASAGFMGQQWDTGETAFDPEFWREVLRVMKPGGHLISFGGTRTYHRMACAIEDAGFEIRDMFPWLYGSGFPKSLNIALEYEKGLCRYDDELKIWRYIDDGAAMSRTSPFRDDNANAWAGYGTAIKPACEPTVLARKPLSEKTVAANVLRWGTGALNIDGCRIASAESTIRPFGKQDETRAAGYGFSGAAIGGSDRGRWPANVIHDGGEEVLAAFPDAPGQQGDLKHTGRARPSKNCYGDMAAPLPHLARNDAGSAARFFYTAKADADDRLGSSHPTIKPVDLMQWLVRLITRKGGLVLDPFAGTGTTGEACMREGRRAVLIEREERFVADIQRRMALALAGPDERARESIKEKIRSGRIQDDPGPLFSLSSAEVA